MHVVSGKLNDDAKVFPSDNGSMFVVRIGVKTRDWNKEAGAEQDVWTNYSASFFCKAEQQKYHAFLQSLLVKGALIVVSAEALVAKVYQTQNGEGVELKMIRSRLMNGLNPAYSASQQGQAPQQARQPQQQYAPQHQAPQQAPAPLDDFDDNVPF